MTAPNFDPLTRRIVGIEGGVADRPRSADPGGLTNNGVTQATYDAWRIGHGLPTQSVRRITPDEVMGVYRDACWNPVRGDDLPAGLDLAVYDYAVNSGPGRAAKDLQRALGTKVDGVIGVATMALIAQADLAKLINDLCDRRLAFMRSLKNWGPNKNGWTARVAHIREAGCAMVAQMKPPPPPAVAVDAPTAKASDSAQAKLKTAEGSGLTAAGAGAAGQTIMNKANDLMPHFGETLIGKLAFAAFALLLIIGGGLIGYSYVRRIKEAGGLGGFIGSVFK